MKREVHIEIYRIIAMFLIIICHICQESTNTLIVSLGQIFNVGVFCFFFLSGYLYSNKKIENNKEWIKKRLKKILVPFYIFMIILFLINFIKKDLELWLIPAYLFNVQYFFGYTTGGGHLWFLTIIMICYFFLPILKKIETKINLNYILVILLILGVITSYIHFKVGYTFLYLFTFTSGYSWKRIEKKTQIAPIKSLVIMGVALIIRILGKKLFDGTPFYDIILFSITHLMLAIGLYCFIKEITKKFTIKENIIIKHLDELSFYIYLTHNIFISKPLQFLKLPFPYLINLVISLICSYLFALGIKNIESMIERRTKRKKEVQP